MFQHRTSQSVVAELDKARGEEVRLAVPAGPYTVLVRHGGELRECEVTPATPAMVTLDLAACRRSSLQISDAKGGAWPGARWGLELALGLIAGRNDAYVDQMRQFDFSQFGAMSGSGCRITWR